MNKVVIFVVLIFIIGIIILTIVLIKKSSQTPTLDMSSTQLRQSKVTGTDVLKVAAMVL